MPVDERSSATSTASPGAAVLGLAAAQPLLLAGAHLDVLDPSDLLERCADLLDNLLASAMQR